MGDLALLIYLDSQDFIRLTDERDRPEILRVWNKLCDFVDRGIVITGLSCLHIAEVLNPDSHGYWDDQRRYGETMVRLSGGAFPFPSDLLEGAEFEVGGSWLPRDVKRSAKNLLSEKELRKFLENSASNRFPLSRADKRRISSKSGRREIAEKFVTEVPEPLASLGVTVAEFRKLLVDPNRSSSVIYSRLIDRFSDPRYYSELVYSARSGENPLLEILHDSFEVASASIRDLYYDYQELEKKRQRALEASETAIRLFEVAGLDRSQKYSELRTMRRNSSKRLPKISLGNHPIMQSPRFDFFEVYVNRMTRMNKAPTDSEIRDLMHLLYLPDVQLIRVDKRMGEILKSDAALVRKIVTRLTDLPERILSISDSPE